MFGYHKAKRANKRLKKEQKSFNEKMKEFETGAPEREKKAAELQEQAVNEKVAKAAQQREQDYQKGRERIKSLYSDPTIEGLPEKERSALQYEANKNIQRSHQAANRQLLGEQAQRGIRGQGGVGYAQQRDLQRLAQEGYGGVQRDIDKLNEQRRIQNIAAIFAGEQGEAAQSALERQMELDRLELADEKKRQRAFEEDFRRQFMRL